MCANCGIGGDGRGIDLQWKKVISGSLSARDYDPDFYLRRVSFTVGELSKGAQHG